MAKTKTQPGVLRLDRFLANAGVGTRSKVKQLIHAGRVSVNGIPEREEGRKVQRTDQICADGVPIGAPSYHYYLMNKPAGVVSATTDRAYETVVDLLSEKDKKGLELFPVGRLDADTTGLILLTDDGPLAHALLSPARHVPKTYLALVRGQMGETHREAFLRGVDIGEKQLTRPARLSIFHAAQTSSLVAVTITEGKYHQVKRMFEAIGSHVCSLQRLAIGPLTLPPELKPGAYRPLTETERASLQLAAQTKGADEVTYLDAAGNPMTGTELAEQFFTIF